MEFEITHTTRYAYGHAAAEAYGEARLTPPNLPSQQILQHSITLDPETRASRYIDHYGNAVDFFSIPYRHQRLTITNRLLVRTAPPEKPKQALEQTVQEARQIFGSVLTQVFDYLQPTETVDQVGESISWAKKYLRASTPLGVGLTVLNEAIYAQFQYQKGATDHSTALATVWKQRAGVCQDFAHVALSVLRSAGLPSRYVCGYIETDAPKSPLSPRLIGAVATHAWVEVLVPGMAWVALDPTNRQWVNERYVAVSYGRDARDASPLRGTFKGSGGQKLKVSVIMKRRAKRVVRHAH